MKSVRRLVVSGLMLAVLFTITVFVNGCSEEETVHTFDGVINSAIKGMYTDNAVIYVKDELVHYCDYETGIDTILCSNVGCVHEAYSKTNNPNPICMAALPYYKCYMALYNNSIYYITSGLDYNGATDIYVEDGSTGGRKLLVSVPYELGSLGGSGAPVLDGVLYIKLRERVVNEITGIPEAFVLLVAINLKSGEYEVIMPSRIYEGQQIPYIEVSDGYVYYCVDYSINEGVQDKRMLFRYDSETKESIKVMNEEAFEKYSFYGVHGDNIYVGKKGENVVYEYDNGKVTEVFSADEGIERGVSICGYLLHYGKDGQDGGKWNYYNLETGEAGTFIRPDMELFFVIGSATENTIFVHKKGNGNSLRGYVAMRIDEYIAGGENYLSDIQFAPSAKPRE